MQENLPECKLKDIGIKIFRKEKKRIYPEVQIWTDRCIKMKKDTENIDIFWLLVLKYLSVQPHTQRF